MNTTRQNPKSVCLLTLCKHIHVSKSIRTRNKHRYAWCTGSYLQWGVHINPINYCQRFKLLTWGLWDILAGEESELVHFLVV